MGWQNQATRISSMRSKRGLESQKTDKSRNCRMCSRKMVRPHEMTGLHPLNLTTSVRVESIVLPIEVNIPIARHTFADQNLFDLSYDIDSLKELREFALI
ncbi:hypothetical protein OSB04_016645 [Centaurea solstitialis]|uniref:Uncharacterized protein n=1 Tax=Centaurea solstitialis TaxID=347529 RepID=A0AA38T1C9_9ASTR|nr:hypothetical protein OSB04_016645 [Centaurea solstitialis]